MCDFSGRLVAWMDRELPNTEAVDVERHVRDCSECRRRVDAYEEVRCAFVSFCNVVTGATKRRRLPPWVPVLSTAAAAGVLLLVFQPAAVKRIPVRPRVAHPPPVIVLETAPRPAKKVQRQHVMASMKTPNEKWALAEPAIQIAIPVEAMFPPGAVPEGTTFIADLSMAADGSVQGLRLQQ